MVINIKSCVADFGNTGQDDCPYDIGQLIGMIGVPKGTLFTDTQAGNILTNLQTMSELDSRTARALPVYQFEGIEIGGDSDPTDSSGYGTTRTVRRGRPTFTTRVYNGIGYHKRIAVAIHQSQGRLDWFPVFDTENGYVIAGTVITNPGGVPSFAPWKMSQVWVPSAVPNTGSASAVYNILWTLSTGDYLANQWAVVAVDSNPFDTITGLKDVYLQATPGATGHIIVKAASGNADLHDLYATQLASNSAWVVTNKVTGAVIASSAVTSTPLGWDITTAATAGTVVLVRMAAPSILSGLTVEGYESNTVEVTIS